MNNKNKIPGPLLKNRREKLKYTHGQMMKSLLSSSLVLKGSFLESVKMLRKGKVRGKDKGPRKQEEAIFRRELIKYLRKNFCKVWRIENSLPGYRGLPDLWVFSLKKDWAGWIELKSAKGILSEDQKIFEVFCKRSNVNHIVARSIEDCDVILSERGLDDWIGDR